MVAEQEIIYRLDLRLQKCPACGSNSRWDPLILDPRVAGKPLPTIRIYCDCGMGILQIELVAEKALMNK